MALLLWMLLAACLPVLCAGSDQVTAAAVPPEDDLLLQAGTEPGSQGALQGPTKLPPHFPDEAAGQGETVPDGSKGQEGLPNSPEGEEEGEEGCREQALSGSVGQIASAMRALGVDLLREIEAEKGLGNAIFSPLSITLALAHLSLGAANQTEKHLLEVLHMDSVPCLHQALREVTQHLQRTALNIAGRLFLQKDFPFKETFLEASQRFYGAKPALLSGNIKVDLEAINSWVAEATNGLIPTMLTELPPSVVMVLLNAIYFRGFWKTKFDPQLTEPSLFYLDEKSAVSVEMMKGHSFPLRWFTIGSLEAKVAKFPFKGNTSFVAIVPSLHQQKNFSQVLSEVTQHLQQTALNIAGRLFLQKDFPFKETFLEASQRFYGAKPALLSGNIKADLEAINSWVAEATNGLIPTMLTELPPSVVMVLLNAIYFRGFWKTKFDPQLTEPSLFYLDEKSAVSVEMMKGHSFPLRWFTIGSLEAKVAKFPFKGNTSFVAIVPSLHQQKNFSQVLSEVLKHNLQRSFPQERPTSVKMPKLHLEDHTELNGVLTRLGLGELFSAPDLSRIAEGPLTVSSIQQRAALELTEDGAKAAAATSTFTFLSFSGFSLDQPFIFMIMEDVTDIPLFMGIIRNPRPEKQVLAVTLPRFRLH
ncbi:alpha-2-antiplasmin [Vipera latastei]